MGVPKAWLKGGWHENVEKLILLKLADKAVFISKYLIHEEKLQTCILRLDVIGENCAYVIYCFI